jgi:lipoate-protein ligase A
LKIRNPNHRNWVLLHSGPGDPAFNMALDEALLEAMPHWRQPVLRFYGWTEPAATFGYFQKYTDVERATELRPLIRRPTGGGIVPHAADWTYSVVLPANSDWHSLRAIESYRRIHEWLRMAFARVNVATTLAVDRSESGPGQCFVGHERFDLLWHGKKIAGAAQRRTKDGLLIQGSVQPPPAVSRAEWEAAMSEAARSSGGTTWIHFEPDHQLRDRAEVLVREKYSQAAYNRKR